MIIELKEAAQQALLALEKSQPHPSNPVIGLTNQDFIDHEETIGQLRTAIQQAEAQQVENSTATPEPVWFHKHWCDGDDIFYRPDDNIPSGSTPLYTHPAPSVPDGLQWFTVAEHGLPEVGEVVVGGLWYTDPWLKPEHATYFMWGQCRVVDTKHRDFKDGKQWRTFGPSHNQITNWARLNPPAMLAAK